MSEHHDVSATMSGASARLWVVGLGPGDSACLTGEAAAVLQSAEVVAGYGPYVELIPPAWLQGKQVIASGMRAEVERCRAAVATALAGRPTALVCSGDAGVYALAGLVLELLDVWGVVLDVEVVPGVPAVCAAAALLGAPLTHDFACVSLSDLLTPWEVIERRVRLALEADFVLVVYNPRSRRREWQLADVLRMACAVRGDDGAVGVVRQARRPGQSVWAGRLDALRPETVDMVSLVIIGNSATRIREGRMITPRGYLDKYEPGAVPGVGGGAEDETA